MPAVPDRVRAQGDVNGRVLFAWTIRRDCFQGLRPTQYEQLSGWSHNSVIGAILWNTLSTMSVLFVCAAKTDYKRLVPNTYLRAAMEGLLLLWPLLAILWHLKLQGIATIAVCLAYYGVKVFAEARAQSWDLHFSIAFWGQFVFTLPMVIVSSNVVTQQRDGLFNMLIYFICVVVPLNALAGDYCMAVAVKAGKANLDGSYKAMLFFSWLANALLILAVLNISSSAFPSNPFSNTASGVWAVTSIVCIIPVLQPRSVWKSEDRWSRLIVNRYSLDLAARIIFTIAVVIDLSATRNVDNLVIGPHP